MNFEWETIHDGQLSVTDRAKVIGGWIVRHQDIFEKEGCSTSMVFIPDFNHEWVIDYQ